MAKIDKQRFVGLAKLFGIQVNEDAIEEIAEPGVEPELIENKKPEYDEEEEMPDEEEMPMKKKKKMMAANSRPAQPARNARAEPEYQNLLKLNQLIDDIGGFDAYRALLLSAVDAVEHMQQNQAGERDGLVAEIVANSSGALTAKDLETTELPVLEKMAQAFAAQSLVAGSGVDYRMLGTRIKQNKGGAEDIAPLPSFLLKNSEEVSK
jgi:hypothetical protein